MANEQNNNGGCGVYIMIFIVIIAIFGMIGSCSNRNSYTNTNSEKGYGYDTNDPYYRKNDKDRDGKLTDEEWQNSMNDFLDDMEKYLDD